MDSTPHGKSFQGLPETGGMDSTPHGKSFQGLPETGGMDSDLHGKSFQGHSGTGPGIALYFDSTLSYPSVTLAVSKKRGTNAVTVARDVIQEFNKIAPTTLPHGVGWEITRNYGETASDKVGSLISSLGFAVASVVVLLALTLGWREALIVAVAVPISFSLALFVNYLFGYTINRVTLFALILSLGLVVDDPITNVENIQRNIQKGILDPFQATLRAVDEVLPPVIMSTLAIIACFIPLFFITGMMGPYMAPMAINVPLTVTFSTISALTIVPWLSHALLRSSAPRGKRKSGKTNSPEKQENHQGTLFKVYKAVVSPFLESRLKRWLLFIVVILLLLLSCSLALFRMVPLKLLPFDNKNEFQIVINMDEGTTLERTDAVVRAFENYLQEVPGVTSILSFTGQASPMDFNGMVRHYYLRKGSPYADIRVNLLPRSHRDQQSHAIVLGIRKDIEAIADAHGARVSLVEVPPGPPVLSTIVGEIYASPDLPHHMLVASADHLETIMSREPFVVDIDAMTEADHEQIEFAIDREKAALHGIDTKTITSALGAALEGYVPAFMHLPRERQPLKIRVTLPREYKSGIAELQAIPLKSASGRMVSLGELVESRVVLNDPTIYHKNLERVVYVLADTAGRAPAEAVLDMQKALKSHPMPQGTRVEWAGEGEWKITIRVFRDMGIAFAAALVAIYILLIIQSGSFLMPGIIMMAIPLTLMGILPGFLLLNSVAATPVGGFANPIFLTATSMIGMIALGGIVIRNSLVLIEFIQDAVSRGMAFEDAIVQSGAIRMRPILLTALTTAIGAFPITLDPVFSGLAWALIFGLFASTLFTLLVIPVTYFAVYKDRVN
ncbi:MAG: efflux RND transporter permease subunit [Desulfamplus sp.]|nr:efflux RND transporter permease subunit [Desulfamplus sp.]